MSNRSGHPVKFRGVDYPSAAAAAAAHGIKRAAVSYRTRHKGETPEQALEVLASSGIAKSASHTGRVRVGSITFGNPAAAASYFGVSPETVEEQMRLNKKLSAAAAIEGIRQRANG